MTKTFQVESKGKLSWRVVRQAAHDPQYKVGSRIPGLGKVVAVAGEITPAMEDALKQFIRDWDYVAGIVTGIEQEDK